MNMYFILPKGHDQRKKNSFLYLYASLQGLTLIVVHGTWSCFFTLALWSN
jgi:hypothetical protein